jgi:chaperonin cofactor prefoldin
VSDANETNANSDKTQDLRSRLKQLAQPLVDSIDTKLRDQVDHRVDERVDASLSARLSVIERAIADLDREVRELKERLDS